MINMVTTLKIGRRKYKNVLASVAESMKGFFTMQSNMWIMCNDAIKRLKKAADRDLRLGEDNLSVIMRYEKEQDDDPNYEIEWIVTDMSSVSYDREYQAYQDILKFNDNLRKTYEDTKSKNGLVINKPKVKVFDALRDKFKLTRDKIEDMIQKGLDKEQNKSICDYLLELDIVLVTIPPETKEIQKDA